jgi:hypothetical protein
LRVEAGGETRSYTLPPGQRTYREESVPFTARAASTPVRLVSTTGGTPYGPLVDDLSLAKE